MSLALIPEQLQEVEQLAGLNYSIRQIALYLDVDPNELADQFADKLSQFHYHYQRGALVAQAKVDMETLTAAKNGNITAQQRYDKRRKETAYQLLKEQLFGRSDEI